MILPRAIKSSRRKGSGFKSGGYHYYGGGGGGGGSRLPLWVTLVIVFSVLWACLYLALFYYFFRKERLQTDPLKKRSRGVSLGRAAWKAFRYATLMEPIIWAVRKLITRFRAGRGAKNVGGTFYRKIEEGEEKGPGMRDVNSNSSSGSGEPVGVVPPAQVRGEPLLSPVVISKGSEDR
ncbi:uncharacterized protein GGS22DRAFT_169864 [Annulohypoxylon maeteangense]|uniref:uncharacterized protein n=1 Tax=Annulohypoxylon maeteangense TaxID=1927788 RepID=UPI0020084C86|nr:uncharacterized protein GGS22DRAFT_169864 [Annulohypoxylon maeteangense]KAI0882608.1 hypothetical protein GGS22DRAFT_169864 [Annulohypoxylon maeteangense]